MGYKLKSTFQFLIIVYVASATQIRGLYIYYRPIIIFYLQCCHILGKLEESKEKKRYKSGINKGVQKKVRIRQKN